MKNDTIAQFQQWVADQCDGDWEEDHIIRIENLSNPGWKVTIEFGGTALVGRQFSAQVGNVGAPDWLEVWVENETFYGRCSLNRLTDILSQFLAWAEADGATVAS